MVNMCVQRRIEGSVAFEGWLTCNANSHSILEFLQPEFYDRIEKLNQHTLLKWSNNEVKNNLWGKVSNIRQSKRFDFEQLSHLI
jgi:hypothetical protein